MQQESRHIVYISQKLTSSRAKITGEKQSLKFMGGDTGEKSRLAWVGDKFFC